MLNLMVAVVPYSWPDPTRDITAFVSRSCSIHRSCDGRPRCRTRRSQEGKAALPRRRRNSSKRIRPQSPLLMAEDGRMRNSNDSEQNSSRFRRKQLIPGARRSLVYLAEAVNDAVLEMCAQNQGRPLAAAMTDLVERGVEVFVSGEGLFFAV